MTMANGTKFRQEVVNTVRESYRTFIPVLDAVIPSTVRLAEISTSNCSIFKHEPHGRAAKAYETLVGEVIELEEKQRRRTSDIAR